MKSTQSSAAPELPHPTTAPREGRRSRALGQLSLAALVGTSAGLASPLASAQFAAPAPAPLLPPPPPPTPEAVNTERELELSEREDSGRGLQFFWLDAEVGGRWYDLALLSDSSLVDGSDLESSGMAASLGVGAGARFLYFTGGARFRLNVTGALPFWTAGLEAGLRIPLGSWEPYAVVGGGYLRSLTVKDACGGCLDELSISGGYASVGGGIDYFVTPVFAVGTRLDLEVPFVTRDALPGAREGIYAEEGSAVGFSANLGLHLSLHF